MAFKHFASFFVILSVLSKATVIKGNADAPKPQDSDQKQQIFLSDMKDYWRKTFGDLAMPPPINTSTSGQPPPKKVMDALMALAATEDLKSGGKQDRKDEAIFEKQYQQSIGNGKPDPQIEEVMAKQLASLFYGPNPDPASVNDMMVLLQGIVNGTDSFIDSNAAESRLDNRETARLKAAVSKSMLTGGNANKQLQHSEYDQVFAAMGVGYGGDHATSTILEVSKCMGPPTLDSVDHDKSLESLFFVSEQLTPAQKMKLQFKKSTNNGPFLDALEEDRTGVTSAVLLIDLITVLGKSMNKKESPDITAELDTVIMCDQPGAKGKNKEMTCAMDLQSMINYTMAKIGKDIRPAATWINTDSPAPMGYTVTTVKKLPAINTVGCTKLGFPCAIFYCQVFPKTVNYVMSLTGEDGSSVKSIVMCHEDTTRWNPNSWIFAMLKTKPGDSKICHFLAADDVAWMPKTQENVAA